MIDLRIAACLLLLLAGTAVRAANPVPCPTDAGGVDLTQAPYGARNDGKTDTSEAFRKAMADPKVRVICLPPGEYRVNQQVLLRTGAELEMLGLSTDREATRITWDRALMPFFSNPTRGMETRVKRFAVRNLSFDGGGENGRALNVLAQPATPGNETTMTIENSAFRNTANLPIWLEGFSKVRIVKSRFQGTKDPGILRNQSVEIVDNEVSDTTDNCLSVSRGNSHVLVARNYLHNCGGSGVFVGGINYPGDPGKSFELDVDPGAGPGTKCTIKSVGSDFFRYGMIGTHLTLRRGEQLAIVTIQGWNENDARSAPCTLDTRAPADLVRKPVKDWFDGPHFGGEHTVIEDNRIEGSKGHGVTLSLGVRDVQVRRNTIRDSGRYRDEQGRETEAPSFGVIVLGWFAGREPGANRYAEDVQITGNNIVGPTLGGVRLGSEITGAVRRVSVTGNRIEMTSPEARLGVLVADHPGMPGAEIRIADNPIAFDAGAKGAIGLRIDAEGPEACSTISQAEVRLMRGGACAVRVGKACQATAAPATLACARR